MKRKEASTNRIRRKCSKPSDLGRTCTTFLSSPVHRRQPARVFSSPRPRLSRFRPGNNPRKVPKACAETENADVCSVPQTVAKDDSLPLLPSIELPPADGALDLRAMEILHSVAARVTGSPLAFVPPNVVLGLPNHTVVGKCLGKAVEVVGVPWGEKESERKIGKEPWCREFYWRIVVHQLAKRENLPRQVLATIVGRSTNSMLALLGGGAGPGEMG